MSAQEFPDKRCRLEAVQRMSLRQAGGERATWPLMSPTVQPAEAHFAGAGGVGPPFLDHAAPEGLLPARFGSAAIGDSPEGDGFGDRAEADFALPLGGKAALVRHRRIGVPVQDQYR